MCIHTIFYRTTRRLKANSTNVKLLPEEHFCMHVILIENKQHYQLSDLSPTITAIRKRLCRMHMLLLWSQKGICSWSNVTQHFYHWCKRKYKIIAVKDDKKEWKKIFHYSPGTFHLNYTKEFLLPLNIQYLWLRQQVPFPSDQQLCCIHAILSHPFAQPTNKGVYEINTNWAWRHLERFMAAPNRKLACQTHVNTSVFSPQKARLGFLQEPLAGSELNLGHIKP